MDKVSEVIEKVNGRGGGDSKGKGEKNIFLEERIRIVKYWPELELEYSS
jgi:hypothetical protein